MGYFTKKADPVSARARSLNNEIAALESQIQRLTTQQEKSARKRKPSPEQPRSRSPQRPAARAAKAAVIAEPAFEEVRDKSLATPAKSRKAEPAERFNELEVRKYDFGAAFRRFFKQFQGAPPSNPKLVNYLAAGSIQGLRPLRYEKRVARNRFIFLVVFLVLLLLGILTSFIGHH